MTLVEGILCGVTIIRVHVVSFDPEYRHDTDILVTHYIPIIARLEIKDQSTQRELRHLNLFKQ